jgi:hypothetical protein
MRVAWFTLEDLGVLLRRHRADDTVTKAIARVLRADLVVVDLCRSWNYADLGDHRGRSGAGGGDLEADSLLSARHSHRASRNASSESDGR